MLGVADEEVCELTGSGAWVVGCALAELTEGEKGSATLGTEAGAEGGAKSPQLPKGGTSGSEPIRSTFLPRLP